MCEGVSLDPTSFGEARPNSRPKLTTMPSSLFLSVQCYSYREGGPLLAKLCYHTIGPESRANQEDIKTPMRRPFWNCACGHSWPAVRMAA